MCATYSHVGISECYSHLAKVDLLAFGNDTVKHPELAILECYSDLVLLIYIVILTN